VRAADTSVVVAALAGWHEAHAPASAAIAGGVRLPAHCLLESYSVLTRLPPPHRFEPRLARELLQARFADEPLSLDGEAQRSVLDRLVGADISGGATYDALIGLTAAHHDALLLSRDQRAARVYAALGVRFELVG
jgi:predicted nucleic acid-binding protein